jgi:glycosyltransferase involved in cell wall biosynthesis
MKIVHYTECFSAGVMSSLATLTKAQVKDNYSVEIVYCSREFTPQMSELKELFGSVILLPLGEKSIRSLFKMVKHFLSTASKNSSNIIHTHSSWAGFVIRLANIFARHGMLFFTPHAYSYLRQDVSKITRLVFKTAETILARFSNSVLLACSNSEYIEGKNLGYGSIVLGGNFIYDPTQYIKIGNDKLNEKYLSVATVGRITAAKNPDRLVRISRKCGSNIQFSWIGGGDIEKTSYLQSSGISVSGWLNHREAIMKVSKIDCLLITSDWEALPMVAIEAMSFSIPIISWNYYFGYKNSS